MTNQPLQIRYRPQDELLNVWSKDELESHLFWVGIALAISLLVNVLLGVKLTEARHALAAQQVEAQ